MAIRTRKKQSNTRLWLLVALLIVVCAVIFLLPSGEQPTAPAPATATEQPDPEAATIAVAGSVAPDFTVELFDGGSLHLADLKGKVVLVNFWATWCPPCREELKRVQADLIDRFAGKDFLFIPISRGEERDTVAAFREQNGYTFTMGLDPERTIYDQYASNYIPRNFLIDRDGKVVTASVGYEPEEFDALIAQIEAMLQ